LSSKQRRASQAPESVEASPVGGVGDDDFDLGLDDDIEAALEQALAASEAAASKAANKRRSRKVPTPSFLEEDDSQDDEGDSATSTLLAFEIEDDTLDDDLQIPGLDDVLDGDSLADRSYDDMDRELIDALTAPAAEPTEQDLQSQMEALLAESFGLGGVLSDDNPSLAFPDLTDEDEEEEDLAILSASEDDDLFLAGDDGVQEVRNESEVELERVRTQVAELSRLLSARDLELRAAEDRNDSLQGQVVAASRQVANTTREFEKFRKRAERDAEDVKKFSGEKIIKEFLGVYDNLERALAHSGGDRDTALGMGVEMTLGQFMAALRRCGADRVDASAGTPFDPTYHEAVGQNFSDEIEAGAILLEMQGGFVLNGRLVRASMVTVSRGPDEAKPAAEPADADADATLDGGDDAAEVVEEVEAKPKAAKKPRASKKKTSKKRSSKSKKTSASASDESIGDDADEPNLDSADDAGDESGATEEAP